MERLRELADLLGETLSGVENEENKRLVFTLEDGRRYALHHDQDCCETVEIEDVCGDLDDLVGSPLVKADEVTYVQVNPEGVPGKKCEISFTWTFYNLATAKGHVTVRWYGTSNGYYSERVDFAEWVGGSDDGYWLTRLRWD